MYIRILLWKIRFHSQLLKSFPIKPEWKYYIVHGLNFQKRKVFGDYLSFVINKRKEIHKISSLSHRWSGMLNWNWSQVILRLHLGQLLYSFKVLQALKPQFSSMTKAILKTQKQSFHKGRKMAAINLVGFKKISKIIIPLKDSNTC